MDRRKRLFWLCVGFFVLLTLALSSGGPPAGAAPPAQHLVQPYVFSGHVYEGETGAEPPLSTPLQNVTVRLHCSQNASDVGTLIASTQTTAEGSYELATRSVCEYYNIIEINPPGYVSVGATSEGGADYGPARPPDTTKE